MGFSWTKEQQNIIDLRDRNILVSAAAGSGKTAVLVERIITLITDPARPIDVDRLLIVTFTRAAAAQMKDRIGKRLSELLRENPEDENLKRQEDLIPHAKIMTIDSFCQYVVRNYFNTLDLDPDFRIGDEDELKLIREDVRGDFLERKYEEGDEDFLDFARRYSGSKNDEEIAATLERIRSFADAYPDPYEQLELWAQEFSASADTLWLQFMKKDIRQVALDVLTEYDRAIEICQNGEGLSGYITVFESDKSLVLPLLDAETLEELLNALSTILVPRIFKTMRKPGSKSGCDEELAETLKLQRDSLKEALKKLAKTYCLGNADQILADIEATRKPMQTLIRLTMEYMDAYDLEKKEKNLVSFADVEHYALQILTRKDPETGARIPTEVADTLKNHFVEIMIDEYQDSNRIQEEILTSISRERDGHPNVFMVGDVKQSIYRFRKARPELFMEKYASYTDDGPYQKIDLHNNFRSSAAVLASTNFVFSQIMTPAVGGILYDEAAALVHTRVIPEKPDGDNSVDDTELLILDTGGADDEEEGAIADLQKQEKEARVIITRIKELTDPAAGYQIYDKDIDGYRTAEYRDIVILLRTVKDWAEIFVEQLMAAGIPAYAQTRTGYFAAYEVQCILSLLRVIDNPMQDIPLTSVLHSKIGNFSSEELADLVGQFRKTVLTPKVRGIYGALLEAENLEISDALKKKCADILALLSDFREKSVYLPLHSLIRYCVEQTGYEYIIRSMPGGKIRLANIELLIQKAMDYEKTSYRSLFRFVHYIETIQKADLDMGEASVTGEQDNTVRIMSIHKSKGLEFPIVFVAGCAKKFNTQEARGSIVLNSELGIAADAIDPETRLKADTLPKKVMARVAVLDTLGEELRMLYVAMTRAKEKLILTATEKMRVRNKSGIKNKWMDYESLKNHPDTQISYTNISGAGNYLEWILMALTRSRVYREQFDLADHVANVFHPLYDVSVPMKIREITEEELVYLETKKQLNQDFLLTNLKELAKAAPDQRISETLNTTYPYEASVNASRKMSVSRLKKAAIERLEADNYELEGLIQDEVTAEASMDGASATSDSASADGTSAVSDGIHMGTTPKQKKPRFLSGEETITGADRGTAYHRIMELLPMATEATIPAVKQAIDRMQVEKLIGSDTAEAVNVYKIKEFLTSDLAKRMAAAEKKGLLYKEKQFVMSLPGEELQDDLEGERILIQGIVDVWFEEDGEIVLMDYKTDSVDPVLGEEILKKRYKVQLDLYKKALEQGFAKPVKEVIIYSFKLEKSILIPGDGV